MPVPAPVVAARAAAYGGPVTDGQLRAVARLALQARGFAPDPATLAEAVEAERVLAGRLAGPVLDERFPALAQLLSQADGGRAPWDRVPQMLALGYRQAALLDAVAGPPFFGGNDVEVLGGLFNAAISVIDHVVDEAPTHAVEELFAAVDGSLLESIFTSRADVTGHLIHDVAARLSDPTVRLAVLLVAAWTGLARQLHDRTGCHHAWEQLGTRLRGLLDAEWRLSHLPEAPTEDVEALSRRKSEGPSRAIADMVALARPSHSCPSEELWRTAEHLGRVLCLADDLADLVADARRGHPNVHLLGRSASDVRLTDPDLYRIAEAAAEELVDELRATAAGPPEVTAFAAEIAARWLLWDQHPFRTPPPGNDGPEGAQAALGFLLRAQAESYRDAAHRLTFPRGPAGGTWQETHAGHLFVRTVALEALLDAFDAGLSVPLAILCQEGLAVLGAKHPDVRTGWNYLQSVPELPPDADDLAQVLAVLRRLGGRPLAAACDDAVRLALDATDRTGGFPTWIFDPRAAGRLDDQMRRYVEVVGGSGNHTEVVANLLAALLAGEPVRYQLPLDRGARFLAERQNADGSWDSTWYAGPYYGTYKSVAVLSGTGVGADHLARARQFIVDTQNATGGWGTGDDEALSTALALLTLAVLDPHHSTPAKDAGLAQLASLQERDGGWPSAPWIRFRTQDGATTYGSRVVTTAFAARALLAGTPPSRLGVAR